MYFSNCMYRVNIKKQDMIQYSSQLKDLMPIITPALTLVTKSL